MYRQQQDASAGAAQHFLSATTPSSSFSQTTFPSPLFSVDPGLHSKPQHLQPSASQGPARHSSPDHRAAVEARTSMQPPMSVSPRLQRSVSRTASPRARSLPSRSVTPEDITDAFVAFILYCNPQFPMDVDTEILRINFNSPPKSDNKDFATYRLFELIQKFDAKEIKTWGQLALDLGVEAPDPSKGQSVQKVQQYSVRLKRWMRAMHIDAFFEYLLGKQHAYFTDLPPVSDPYPAAGRDGVVAEEDLAIRALEPSFRPKRGRRRNSETDQDADGELEPVTKQSRLNNATGYGQSLSAYPASAHPDGYHDPWAMASAVTPHGFAPWSSKPVAPQTAVTSTAPAHLRWQLHGGSNDIATPHPMTAQPTSMAAHIEAAFDATETKTPSRKRRKHGPAVSSAWPSATTPGAKPRGRPPASRNIQDGPFSTFPADPANEKAAASARTETPEQHFASGMQEAPTMVPPLVRRPSEGPSRPGKLSLQVPQHTGGPVRLATPPMPPRVLVNGESNDSDGRSTDRTPIGTMAPPSSGDQARQQLEQPTTPSTGRDMPVFGFEALKRVLASDLLRAQIVGRQQRLSGEEAKRLADSVLQRLGVPKQDTEASRDDIARLTAASWLGLGEQLHVPLGPATSQGKRISVTRFRTDTEGYEEIISAYDDNSGNTREVYDLSWSVTMAGCNGNFELTGLSLGEASVYVEDTHDALLKKYMSDITRIKDDGGPGIGSLMRPFGNPRPGFEHDDENTDWKAKYMALEFSGKLAYGELSRLKESVLQKLLDVLL